MDKYKEHEIYLICEKAYNNIIKTLGELQPIAFFIAVSLALAGIFTKQAVSKLF
jgi:hypothetical protein